MSSPTARAMAHCRKHGWRAAIVEKWIPQVRRKKDVFGFGDLLVLDDQPGPILVQVTSGTNVAARVSKIQLECAEDAKRWLAAGGRVQVWGFSKRVLDNRRTGWALRVVTISGEDLAAANTERLPTRRRKKSRQLGLLEPAVTEGSVR